MPYSSTACKQDVKQHLIENLNNDLNILDVGPGCGTYWGLLRNSDYKIDCLEIYEPYIEHFKLKDKYRNVHNGDIRSFDFSAYDYIIMGDVFEHISFDDATDILNRINDQGIKCIIAVPFESEQGESFGNVHETHLQVDLTFDNMLEKYPSLRYLFGDPGYGYYVNY